MERYFVSADTFGLAYAVGCQEQAFAMDTTGFEELQMLLVEFTAQRAGVGVEGINLPAAYTAGDFGLE